jgi:RimJ/RimL family protein N-acetyltransferase
VLEVEDAEDLQRAIEESRFHLEPFMPFVSHDPRGLAFRKRWIAQRREAFAAGTAFQYGIVRRGAIVGGCGIIPRSPHTASIGFWVHPDHTRQGVATAVAGTLTKTAIEVGFTTVMIRHDEANQVSGVIAARLGFTFVRQELHAIDAPGQTGRSVVWQFERDD